MGENGGMIGRTLGHFRIDAKLGEGGMGIVYRATDETLRREVALKVLPESLAADPERRGRFLREARAAAAVTHNNIATVHEVGEAGGHVFIAMELVEGQTLRDRMAPGLPRVDAMRFAREIARGLARAHEKGIVHRDLKPENVMITPDGDVKILDFGLAKVLDTEPSAASASPTGLQATAEGRVMGTPAYMSPEQAEGRAAVDARSDVFSFGVMLYEMLSGTRPFQGSSSVEILYAVLHREPEPLGAVCAGVPESTARLVAGCLEKERDKRFASARELLAPLEAGASPESPDATSGQAAPPERVSTVSGLGTAFGPTMAGDAVRPATPPRHAEGEPLSALAPTDPPIGSGAEGQRARQGRMVSIVAGALLAGGLAWWGIARQPNGSPLSAVASASPSAAVAAPPTVACRDVPIPDSNKPEAVASYRAGMQAWCDANQALAENDLQRAVDLDPTLAAAHLRLSRELFDDGDTEAARRELETAQQLRVSLSPRDLDVLAFYEPIIMHSPPNWEESRRRRDAAVVRSPEMAELWALRAAADLSLHEFGRARADATRAATLDPSCAMARLILAQAEGGEGKLDAEKAALDECLQVAPNAGSCLYTRAMLRARQGDCVGFGSDGEALVAASPNDWRGRYIVTSSLALRDAPADTLRSSKGQDVARVPARAGWQAMSRIRAETVIALWFGDFPTAETSARARLGLRENTNSTLLFNAARDLIRALLESGRLPEAGKAANELLEQSEVWDTPRSVGEDGTPVLLEVARRAGVLTPAEWSKRLEAWVAKWNVLAPGKTGAENVMFAAYLFPAETRADAEDAVRRLPELLPLAARLPWGDFPVGKAYFLAGNIEESVPYLQRAASSCTAFESGITTTHAALMLGQALEQKHDKAGACAAYGQVVTRWGHAKPKSISADAARDGMKRLACPP